LAIIVAALAAFVAPARVLAATTYVVTNASDSGAGSLRAAILDSNAHVHGDRITFNIPGPAPHTISVLSQLPTITTRIVIDGTTEPGYSGSPSIQINNGSGTMDIPCLTISAGSSTVRALDITNFANSPNNITTQGVGIELTGGGANTLAANWIGLDTAKSAAPNAYGVIVTGGSASNVISGNVVSGNTYQGIVLLGTGVNWNEVVSNDIGTNPDGTSALGNGWDGVNIGVFGAGPGPEDNVIHHNVVSANGMGGVSLFGPDTEENVVSYNHIGTNATGTAALGNSPLGIHISQGAEDNLVVGNLISGNTGFGFGVRLDTGAFGNRVNNDRIGVDSRGKPLGNSGDGVSIAHGSPAWPGATNNVVENSVIASSGGDGVHVDGSAETGNEVVSNSIYANSSTIGIDLTGGANDGITSPTITSVMTTGGTTTITGTTSHAGAYRIQVFANSSCGDPEGKALLASFTETSGGWTATVPALAAGSGVTATNTATGTVKDTSQFSSCSVA
jgi:parallel beta-helix repeat protein